MKLILKILLIFNKNTMFKQIPTIIILTCSIFFLVSCQFDEKQNEEVKTSEATNLDWLNSFDFDGDGLKDRVHFDYTGGGHCCYKMSIVLSSDKKEIKYPFEKDGGYIAGVDNSQPEQFDIKDIDNDGLPEIIMRIQTYNGESERLDTAWHRIYGITSNYIVIEYEDGRLMTRDFLLK